MSARHVHAVLAAALDNPDMLEQWCRAGSIAQEAGIEVASLDLKQFRLFAGLANKIRQNDIRFALPLTFRLLDHLGLSIELFAAYAVPAAALRKASRKSKAEKILSLSQFLAGWLDDDNREHALLGDIIRHERALTELRDGPPAPSRQSAPQRSRITIRSKPRRHGRLIYHEMSCDPLALAATLRADSYDPASLARGLFFFVYRWDDRAACIRVDEIDALGFEFIKHADGSLSLARMATSLRQAGLGVQARDLLPIVQDLVDSGLLTLDGGAQS